MNELAPTLVTPSPNVNAKHVLKAALPPDRFGWWWGTGRRKTAVARVRIKPGTGQFTITCTRKKTKSINEYFSEVRDRNDCVAPLKISGLEGKFDVVCRCDGGGFMGQAQAVRLGVARALKGYDPTLEVALRDAGFLTRDPREVERKKYGQAGARRRFQFSKR
jgi:small subunit ribosomal protein S9